MNTSLTAVERRGTAIRSGALALALLFCAGPALAAKKDGLYYLDKTTAESLQKDFAKPPAPGSEEEKADFAAVLDWQGRRTAAQCAAAEAQKKAVFDEFFPGGDNPFGKTPPQAEKILKKALNDISRVYDGIKNSAKRPRPFRARTECRPCISLPGSFYSYPSGHAARSMLYALILSDLLPDAKGKFMADAGQAGENRIIGGVHFPSDVKAGQELAAQVHAELLKKENFRKDLESLRKYLSK